MQGGDMIRLILSCAASYNLMIKLIISRILDSYDEKNTKHFAHNDFSTA